MKGGGRGGTSIFFPNLPRSSPIQSFLNTHFWPPPQLSQPSMSLTLTLIPNTQHGFQSPNFSFITATRPLSHNLHPPPTPYTPYHPYSFSFIEEVTAEHRWWKRRLCIELPFYALRPYPASHLSHINNPDKPQLLDFSFAHVSPCFNLYTRVQSLIRDGDLDLDPASYVARQFVFQSIHPMVFTCNAIIIAMYRAKRYVDAKALFQCFFNQCFQGQGFDNP